MLMGSILSLTLFTKWNTGKSKNINFTITEIDNNVWDWKAPFFKTHHYNFKKKLGCIIL